MSTRDAWLEKASRLYHNQFINPRNASRSAVIAGRTYLTEHGLPTNCKSGRDVVRKYQIGVVVNPLKGDEQFKGMLSIPYLTPRGTKAIKFRRLDGGKPKYAAPKHQQARLYNPAAYFASEDVIGLAEGEIDAIVATERLHVPTMGVPGAEVWTAYSEIWKTLFKNNERVFVFIDGDKEQIRYRNGEEVKYRPGAELGDAISESLKTKVTLVTCPEGFDVSSMVASGRSQELLDQMAEEAEDEEPEETEDEEDIPPF